MQRTQKKKWTESYLESFGVFSGLSLSLEQGKPRSTCQHQAVVFGAGVKIATLTDVQLATLSAAKLLNLRRSETSPLQPGALSNRFRRKTACRATGAQSQLRSAGHRQHSQLLVESPNWSRRAPAQAFGNVAAFAWMIPTITPKSPRAEPKISSISIFTKRSGFCASPRAQPEPDTPTQIPQNRLDKPTKRPVAKRQYPDVIVAACQPRGTAGTTNSSTPCILLLMMMAIMTP